MAFNLNISRKPERDLYKSLIDETISMYGIKCKYLYTKKINKDLSVFKDFSHLKSNKDYKDIYLLPEESENWEGDVNYNLFGFHNNWTQHLYISKKSMYELFPEFLKTGRHEMVNSLIITPSSTILEITHVESFDPGVSNTWAYADQPSAYKLTVKIYDNNISDEGLKDIKTTIKLEETGQSGEENIFEYDEIIDTSDIDKFFDSVKQDKIDIDQESKTGTTKNRTGQNDTNSPFGNLS